MSIQPTNKYLMADYRDSMGTGDAPQMIDTEVPLTPVAVVNNGLPRPSNKQTYRTYTVVGAGAGTINRQVATPTSKSTKIYFVGAELAMSSTTTSMDFAALDSTSQNTFPADTDTNVLSISRLSSAGNAPQHKFIPLPLECKQGLRVYLGTAVGGGHVTIHYIEERLD